MVVNDAEWKKLMDRIVENPIINDHGRDFCAIKLMKKLLPVLVLLISSNCVGQIWKYPNLPAGFELLEYPFDNNLKSGIKSETIIVIQEKDTVHTEKSYYNSSGRQIMRVYKGDTLSYEYNAKGLLVGKTTSEGNEKRNLVYNEKGQLTALSVIFNNDTLDKILYKYNLNSELPVKVEFENGNSEERTYCEDGKLKCSMFFEQSELVDSLRYFYFKDTISYSNCSKDPINGQWTCEMAYGVYNKNGRIIKVVSEIRKGQNTVNSITEYRYDKQGKLIKVINSHTDGSSGKAIYYYDKNNFMVKSVTFNQGKKRTTTVYTTIEKR